MRHNDPVSSFLLGLCFLLPTVQEPVSEGGSLPFARAPVPKVGEFFPTLEFPTLGGGESTSLAAFRGRKILLIQFASW
ncbi:MAG: hypothetical protein DWQ01_13595 [Planctomycetota bacterium]|nr:MAG: hypothetical protein DWQ01_13595 [Planctomycetota bacterium]